jgi:hypothetical protein
MNTDRAEVWIISMWFLCMDLGPDIRAAFQQELRRQLPSPYLITHGKLLAHRTRRTLADAAQPPSRLGLLPETFTPVARTLRCTRKPVMGTLLCVCAPMAVINTLQDRFLQCSVL